jgi:hypothetical protein
MIERALRRLFEVVADEAATNAAFARKLEDTLGPFAERYVENRRIEREIDGFHPFVEYRKGTPEAFVARLNRFSPQALKAIIDFHQLDKTGEITGQSSKRRMVAAVVAAAEKRAARDQKLFEY